MPMVMEGEGGKKMICDGLVCSIANALSREADLTALTEAVKREFGHDDIFESWKLYFTVFNTVICKERKKPVIDIGRTDLGLCIGDIITHLKTFEKADDLEYLMMPWNYKLNPLESDADVLAKTIVESNSLMM